MESGPGGSGRDAEELGDLDAAVPTPADRDGFLGDDWSRVLTLSGTAAGTPGPPGFELPVGIEIFRGRYVDNFARPRALRAGKAEQYRFTLPNVNHVFLPGHRIMVQVQSSLFPLYDRNPQSFVPNIFLAKPTDYRKATQRVFLGGESASAVELPVVPFTTK